MLKFCGKESGKSRGLRGNVGYVGAWFTWVHGCVGYVGQIFLRGSNFFFAWVFACVKISYVGPKLLGGSIFFLPWSTFIY